MKTLKENVAALHNMILQGDMLTAFDKFYAENVVMQENHNEPVVGKEANRVNEEQFVNNITEFRNAAVKEVIYNDEYVVTQWHFDFDHRDWGTRNYDQLSVQQWQNGQIVYEKFYYSK